MRGPQPTQIRLTNRERVALEQIVRRQTSPQREVTRAKILLAAADGENNQHIATRLGLHRETVRTWRDRWAGLADEVLWIEPDLDDALLLTFLRGVLNDEPRSGTPNIFTPEQICQIVAVACEPPSASGHPGTHWTPSELADEAIKRRIVPTISPSSVRRFLKSGRSQTAPVPLLADQ